MSTDLGCQVTYPDFRFKFNKENIVKASCFSVFWKDSGTSEIFIFANDLTNNN